MTFLANNYNRKKISFKKGIGSYLVATNGKKYLDFCSGIAVNSLGHANPRLVKALYKHCLLYTSPSPRDRTRSRMPSSA